MQLQQLAVSLKIKQNWSRQPSKQRGRAPWTPGPFYEKRVLGNLPHLKPKKVKEGNMSVAGSINHISLLQEMALWIGFSLSSKAIDNMTCSTLPRSAWAQTSMWASWLDNPGCQGQSEGTRTCCYDGSLLTHPEKNQTHDHLSWTLFALAALKLLTSVLHQGSSRIIRGICTRHIWSLQFGVWVSKP